MSVAEIIEEIQNLSLEELKIIAKALRETAEDRDYLREPASFAARLDPVIISHS